jgi:hypothetical protein
MKLLEGGNVFKTADGQPATQRINKADVPATIRWLESVLGMRFPQDRWLGSTGRAATSGDLDLAVDLADADKEAIAQRLTQFVQKNGQDPRDWVRKSGEVHFKTPIGGRAENGFVQADFMFFPNVDWGTFYYAGGTDSAYKGMMRNVLMSSLAKHQGLKVGANGMLSRATNEPVRNGMNPDYVAQVLLGRDRDRNDLKNVETIYQNLARDPERDAKLQDFRDYLAREGLQEPDLNMQESDSGFLARLRDRIVNQGMVPLVEEQVINQPLNEAKEPRIPYVEDLVFKAGLKGLQQAISIIEHSADRTREYVTIKWDGSPALIFGRKPNGEFVLTDKAGAVATGYDGLATSPQMIANIMARRDASAVAKGKVGNREGLVKTYQDIWPYFEAAVPENFRGFVKGDLLYFPAKPYVEEAGNYVFMPNTIEYRIPVNSPLGQEIAGTKVGIAMHSQMEDPLSPETPITQPIEKMFNSVPGLMMTLPTVRNLQNIVPDKQLLAQLKSLTRQKGAVIAQLLKPDDLRAMRITDLPALMEKFINSLKGTDYSNATPAEFGRWLQSNVTPAKFTNIIEYLQSPTSNVDAMAATFTAWNLLHDLKTDLQRQLDLQSPGQEGWVMATPAGRAKLVSRRAGGFAAANLAKNRP